VFSISRALLSPTGGELLVRGQAIAAGSFLVLEIDGTPPSQLSVPLEDLGGGVWRASVAHPFVPGGSVISAIIADVKGTTLVTLNLPLTVTPITVQSKVTPGLATSWAAGFSPADNAVKPANMRRPTVINLTICPVDTTFHASSSKGPSRTIRLPFLR